MIKLGQKIHCDISRQDFTVKKKLGEGSQGTVYLVEDAKKAQRVIKYYNAEQTTDDQRKNIIALIRTGPPRKSSRRRFVWPLDIVKGKDNKFIGYLMDIIDRSKYAELGEIWSGMRRTPRILQKCVASYQIAQAYRALHLEGYCYKDISQGNVMIDPATGDVLICDNDNISVNNSGDTQVYGTLDYMAPEVITRAAKPSIQSDLFSLAVLLFHLWIKHHPYHGLMEYSFSCWDRPAQTKVYSKAVFIFDPKDKSNRLPDDPDYETPRNGWLYCPVPLRNLFTRTFTRGAKNPDERVTEGEWLSTFIGIMDNIFLCPDDGAEIIVMPSDTGQQTCWHCGKKWPKPAHMIFTRSDGTSSLVLQPGQKILKRHIEYVISEEPAADIIGEVVQNPKDASMWGVKNLSGEDWGFTNAQGETRSVPSGRSVPVFPGNVILFPNGASASFQA